MARCGKCDFSELEELRNKIEEADKQKDQIMQACAKEIAVRLLAAVTKRTPVRNPKTCPPGVVGGTLKRGWTIGHIEHVGGVYRIPIFNPVEYASYVEYGHRTRDHKDWVEGKFMMTISEQEIQSVAPRILENKIKKLLGDAMK